MRFRAQVAPQGAKNKFVELTSPADSDLGRYLLALLLVDPDDGRVKCPLPSSWNWGIVALDPGAGEVDLPNVVAFRHQTDEGMLSSTPVDFHGRSRRVNRHSTRGFTGVHVDDGGFTTCTGTAERRGVVPSRHDAPPKGDCVPAVPDEVVGCRKAADYEHQNGEGDGEPATPARVELFQSTPEESSEQNEQEHASQNRQPVGADEVPDPR